MEPQQLVYRSDEMPSGDLVFMAHSHHDHAVAFGISEWIIELWPDVMVYATHIGTTELIPSGFLHFVPQSKAFICILSRNCFGSNAVFDEVRVAAASQTHGIPVLHPSMSADDRREFEWIISEWQKKLGQVVDLSIPEGERVILARLANALQRKHPVHWSEGSLMRCLSVNRVPPPRTKRQPLDVGKVLAGNASREEAVEWLVIQESVLRDRLLIAGKYGDNIGASDGSSPERRAVYLLLQVPPETWSLFMQCLKPLMNDDFRKEVTSLFGSAVARRFPGRLTTMHEMSVQVDSQL